MKFDSLKDRMEYFKELANYKLIPNSYVLAHIDGRSFSKMVKKRFELPFDDKFINMMNNAAKALCENVQGCKLAYVQSDEISLVLTDFDTEDTDAFFSYRLCKMQPILGEIAANEFNKQMLMDICNCPCSASDMQQMIADFTPLQFDCKVWNVPSYNDVFAWLKYRQNDCIRNSKQQTAQTYLPKKQLFGMKCDEQIQWLKDEQGISWWHDFDDGKKYGRIIYKENEDRISVEGIPYNRAVWTVHNTKEFNKEDFENLNIVPKL